MIRKATDDQRILMLRSLLLICVCLLIFTSQGRVFGQVNADIRKVDEFDPRQGCETMAQGLDLLFSETSNNAPANAYVVIHQGNNFFDNAVVHRAAIGYARIRRFPADRYTVILTKGTEDIKVELWVGKNGKEPHVVPSDPAVKLSDNVSRTQFAEDTLELVKIDGRETYIGTGNPSCLSWFNTSLVWDLLKVNSEFEAELRVKTKSSKRYKKLVAILKTEFQEIGVPIERLRFVYGGRDKELEGGGSKLASVTTTFVRISRQ